MMMTILREDVRLSERAFDSPEFSVPGASPRLDAGTIFLCFGKAFRLDLRLTSYLLSLKPPTANGNVASCRCSGIALGR